MAYARKHSKPDIRSLSFDSTPTTQPTTASADNDQAPLLHHDLKREIIAILTCSLPLVIVLIIVSYLDTSRHWVVPLAERLLKLGS